MPTETDTSPDSATAPSRARQDGTVRPDFLRAGDINPPGEGDRFPPIPRRTSWPSGSGASLLLNWHAEDLVLRMGEWCEMSGLDAADMASSPLTSTPLPYLGPLANPSETAASPDPGPGRRWPTVRPEALWHPLFWLPSSLAYLDPIRDSINGGVDPDHDDESAEAVEAWMVRVCIELEANGIYDPQLGWVDVLSAAGIDLAQPATNQRVQAWLDGQPDDILDRIDLTSLFTDPQTLNPTAGVSDDQWVDEAVQAALPILRHVAYVVTADDLAAVCQDLTDPDAEPLESPQTREAVETVLLLASQQLPDLADLADGRGGVSDATLERVGATVGELRAWPTWNELLDRLTDGDSAWTAVSHAQAGCVRLRAWFWPAVAQVQQLAQP